MTKKHSYEEAEIEIVRLYTSDVITSSSPFDGEDDDVSEWGV